MTDLEKREAAKQFYQKWNNRGHEDEDDRSFWLDLLERVLGVTNATDYIEFQKKVIVSGNTKKIDAYIPETKVLIEHKSLGIDLSKPARQSGGIDLTPYEQAKRYNDNLPYDEKARWIITSNFSEIWIYDMNTRVPEAQKILLSELQSKHPLLDFLVNQETKEITYEMAISFKAGDLVGKLYNALLKQYKNPEDEQSLKSLNMLCVRLVFCLYAEDAGLFGSHLKFDKYLKRFDARDMRGAIINLFRVLNQPEVERDKYLDEELASFPYVNGGLFADEDIEIPNFTDEIIQLLLKEASEGFDWSEISPTIFGAVFESTLNPETRRKGGMHYTSIEDIHKVIDPLFLDDLRAELDTVLQEPVERTRNLKIENFQNKLSSLTFFDPACGSGNFLTETYISLRRMENECLRIKNKDQGTMFEESAPIKVSIGQFYGIEINDFAVTVARTALWIAESQMMKETQDILYRNFDFLPLKSYANIVEGNSLRINWEEVVPKNKLNYIMGNPPFVGLSLRSEAQQKDMLLTFPDNDRAGRLDYVTAWYKKAAAFMKDTAIQAAFVSTNSIVQGEQVPVLWEDLLESCGITINFAHRPFVWSSEAKDSATVHCVIIGFSYINKPSKTIFENDIPRKVDKINGYLVEADNIFIQLRGKAPKHLPRLVQGSKPWDGGNLILTQEERDSLISRYPESAEFIKRYVGSNEFINNKLRYCLWLKGVSPNMYRKIPDIVKRLEAVAEVRKKTKTVAVQAQAETPMLFSQIRQPEKDYILIPETSSEKRKYIPIGFLPKDIIASNATLIATDATLYHFGILTSNVHMAWTSTVCGRLEMRYRYSPSVYNNFPWPVPTEEQKAEIEQTAQAILDARALYPDSSLADLYDELTMPPELRKAHQANDRAVMRAYGFDIKTTTESSCVAELMKLYEKMVKE